MWETLLGLFISILLTLAFFVLGKVFLTSGYKANKGYALLVFAIAAILLSILLVINFFGLELILKKLAGLILLAFGFFMVSKFPSAVEYQPAGFFWLGIFIGLFCSFLGIYWLLF